MHALVDTHCHLDAPEFDADRDAVLAEAKSAGVGLVVVPSVEASGFDAVTRLASNAGVAVAYGIHPLYVMRASDDDVDRVRSALSASSHAVAVGEIGLDGFDKIIDAETQDRLFVEQLRIARELDLPVILHVRSAIDRVLYHLRRVRVRGGIAHAWNGSAQQAAAFLDLGFKLGFGGVMTHPRARHIRRMAAELPLDALVLETDAPDLPPVWAHGERNAPAHLPAIARVLAELRGTTTDAIAEATTKNARDVLPGLRF